MRPFTILLCATCLIGCSGDGTPTSTASNEWYIKWLNVSWEPEREFVAEFELLSGDSREIESPSQDRLFVGFVAKESAAIHKRPRGEMVFLGTPDGENEWGASVGTKAPFEPVDGKIQCVIRNDTAIDTRVMIYKEPAE